MKQSTAMNSFQCFNKYCGSDREFGIVDVCPSKEDQFGSSHY